MISRQATFDMVVKHLRKQGRKAKCPVSGNCLYKAADGCTCPAGHLIPAELYDPAFEGMPVLAVTRQRTAVGDLLVKLGHCTTIVHELQTIHDWFGPSSWEARLAILAKKHKLTMPLKE